MLIGIDMLGVQSPEGGDREAGRLGRQLVAALLARDPVNRYVLYTHEGLPAHRIPSARNALRVSLAPGLARSSRLRPTIQRVLDRNPDGLDWLLLLDPFEALYGGLPPESPLNGLRVASLINDLSPSLADDRRLVPLRRHDAILAVSEATAAECRRRLGSASWRVKALGLACDESFAPPDQSEPLTRSSGDELGRLGITGPFLLASMAGGPARANLVGILDAYRRLPFEHRRRHQLAIAGVLDDPWGVIGYLHEQGCSEGLVLVGDVDEPTLRTLYGRCAAFVSPSIDEGSGRTLVEAMRCGAPVVAGRAGAQPEIVGNAGLLVDPSDPSAIAGRLADLLSDVDLERALRRDAVDRSSTMFSWGPVVADVLDVFEGEPAPSPTTRFRADPAHVPRPRVAVFPDMAREESATSRLDDLVPAAARAAYGVDLYLEPGESALIDGLPSDLGGFDARQFDRNDGILGYHAVLYSIADVADLDAKLARLRRRPGLVLLRDRALLDRIAPEVGPMAEEGPVDALRDPEADRASNRLRELFLTTSRVAVESPRDLARVRGALPEFAGQVVEIPPSRGPGLPPASGRQRVRMELDLLPGSIVIGLFGTIAGAVPTIEALALALPGAAFLPMDGLPEPSVDLKAFGRRLPAGGRDDLVSILDLAVHAGAGPFPGRVALVDLLRAGVATITGDPDFPDDVVRRVQAGAGAAGLVEAVRSLVDDPEARAALGRSARAHALGMPDPAEASARLMIEIERCAAELARGPGRPRRTAPARAIGHDSTPHSRRNASTPDEAASRSR